MPPLFSTSVKNSTTNTLSFSIRRKSPSIMPALGAIQTCSATRGPQSPRQRPSSHEKSASFGPESDCGGVAEAADSDAAAGPALDCEPAAADCGAESAADEENSASAAPHANRKQTAILNRNTFGLRKMQR